jgi:hypothetical protein
VKLVLLSVAVGAAARPVIGGSGAVTGKELVHTLAVNGVQREIPGV